jgi:fumarate reductase flavoprotein subunit
MMMGGIAFENWKVGGYYASIISNDILERMEMEGMPFAPFVMFLGQGTYIPNTPISDMDTILSVGKTFSNVVQAATLEELAVELKIDGATLRATVEQYNKFVDGAEADLEYDKSSVFDFGSFTNVNYFKTKVTENTDGYTAILGAGYYYGTCGGLDIDGDMQVLDKNKQKIPGLYAVGQDSMGVLFNAKKAYVGYGAAAQGWAITSGRLAGEKAVQPATAGN